MLQSIPHAPVIRTEAPSISGDFTRYDTVNRAPGCYGGVRRSPDPTAVAEQNLGWHRIEGELEHWWFRQAGEGAHICVDGERVRILDPGRVNTGPGPDVLDVELIMDDRLVFGAVEFHIRSSDWFLHGHHEDSRYEKVILHVVGKAGSGPDLPTLVVEDRQPGTVVCLATRPAMKEEWLELAIHRFRSKVNHLNQLGSWTPPEVHPLILVLIECVVRGRHRHQILNQLAEQLGPATWPDSQRLPTGRGARMIHSQTAALAHRILVRGLDLPNLHLDETWQLRSNPWRAMGVSDMLYGEWLINGAAPWLGERWGLQRWLSTAPFREYALERRLRPRLGLRHTESIGQQQALVAWSKHRCDVYDCTQCPLYSNTV